MGYNWYFALASVPFIGLTAAFYLRQRRMRDLEDHVYTVMLLGGLAAVTFDCAAAAAEGLGAAPWLLYTLNLLFILGEQVCLPAFFLYTVSSAGRYNRLSRAVRALVLAPFAAVLCLALLSPLGRAGIFYIDAGHAYQPGATHWTLYAASALYMGGSCAMLAANYRAIPRARRILCLLYVAVILGAILIQLRYPRLLLVTPAAALAVTAMYYVLRAPGEQVDPFTGAFCRMVLPAVLQELGEKKRPCTLVLYSLHSYNETARVHGTQLADALLVSMSAWLRGAFPGGIVVYMDASEFTVILPRALDDGELAALRRNAPRALPADGGEFPVKLALAALVHAGGDAGEGTLTVTDYLFRQMRSERGTGLLIADGPFRERCGRLARLEAAMERIMREGEPALRLQPVRRADAAGDGPPAVYDASLSLCHDELRDITPGEFLSAVKQSGHIRWYYQRLLSLLGRRAGELTGAGARLCIPLFDAALIQDDMAVTLFDLASEAGLSPRMILFRLSEADAGGQLPAVADNIRRLAAFGFGFRLDGFAEGYTDMSLLTALPIGSILIDGALLRQAAGSARGLELLRCVVGLLAGTGKEVACGGVETAADAAVARAAGAPLLHGGWCGAEA